MGPALMQHMRDQAERFGTRFITDLATSVELATEPGGVHKVVGRRGRAAPGAHASSSRWAPSTRSWACPARRSSSGRGVSYCATCDAAFFKDADTVIVGGGDSRDGGGDLPAKFAGKVNVVHRRDEFRASKIMLERARSIDNIELLTPYSWRSSCQPVEGDELPSARLRNVETGEERVLEVTGTFIAIGHEPQSEIVAGQVDLDDERLRLGQGRSTRTNRPGVFAAGDLVDHTYRQAITAAGSGCQAALDAEWYLRDTPQVPAGRSARGRPGRGAVGALGRELARRSVSARRRGCSAPRCARCPGGADARWPATPRGRRRHGAA